MPSRRVALMPPNHGAAWLAPNDPLSCFLLREIAALGINRCPTHNSPMDKLYYERADYSVVVKNRAPPPKAWRWEIYRAGNANPIKQSPIYFDTTAAARRAGKDALKELLNKLFT